MSVQDEALSARVRTALGMDKRVSGLPIDVRASDGDIFLSGTVDSLEQSDIVQFIANGIHGVRRVDVSGIEIREERR